MTLLSRHGLLPAARPAKRRRAAAPLPADDVSDAAGPVRPQARATPADIGQDVTDNSRVITYDGSAYLSLTRGNLAEITAVPEIARQTARIAGNLARS